MLCHITFLVYLVVHTNHFLWDPEEDVESLELNVAKRQRDKEEGPYHSFLASEDPGVFPSWMHSNWAGPQVESPKSQDSLAWTGG